MEKLNNWSRGQGLRGARRDIFGLGEELSGKKPWKILVYVLVTLEV